jgi:lysophospholipase L1-like esterase
MVNRLRGVFSRSGLAVVVALSADFLVACAAERTSTADDELHADASATAKPSAKPSVSGTAARPTTSSSTASVPSVRPSSGAPSTTPPGMSAIVEPVADAGPQPSDADVPAQPSASTAMPLASVAPTTAAASASVPVSTDSMAVKIVVLGASTCTGKNLHEAMYGGTAGAKTWVELYREHLQQTRPGSDVVGLCVNSYGTYEALPTGSVPPADRPAPDPENNITKALTHDPDAVIVSYPSNGNIGNGFLVSELIANLRTIAEVAGEAGVDVWVTAPNPQGPTKTDAATNLGLLDLKAEIEAEFGDHALDFWTPRVLPGTTPEEAYADPAYLLTDDSHPNAAGHQLLFDVVRDGDIPQALFSN